MELVDTILVYVEVEIIDDQIYFNASFGCIDKFLHSNARDCFVVHIVSSYHYQVLRSVNFVPKRVPKSVVVVVQLNFWLLQILIFVFSRLHFYNQWLINYLKSRAKPQPYY